MSSSRHELVVGGSGMLAGFCRRLADSGSTVSVIGRSKARLERLKSEHVGTTGKIVALPVDYSDKAVLTEVLKRSSMENGAIHRAVCWIHDEIAPDGPLEVAQFVTDAFWHLLGSASANPGQPDILLAWRDRFRLAHPSLSYRQVVLGFVRETDRSRWLTDAEISAGVEAAFNSDEAVSIVGRIDPWDFRP